MLFANVAIGCQQINIGVCLKGLQWSCHKEDICLELPGRVLWCCSVYFDGNVPEDPEPCLNMKTIFPRYEIPMFNIRLSWNRLIFTMGILYW